MKSNSMKEMNEWITKHLQKSKDNDKMGSFFEMVT